MVVVVSYEVNKAEGSGEGYDQLLSIWLNCVRDGKAKKDDAPHRGQRFQQQRQRNTRTLEKLMKLSEK